jgi:imidazolonepropionase-like amidohydrolase
LPTLALSLVTAVTAASAQTTSTNPATLLLVPERVFDAPTGITHTGWTVLVRGDRIVAVGPATAISLPADARRVELPNTTLLPGLIEGHGHLFLHPYIEAPYADQVLREPLALRIARATVAARRTLAAGFTTERDLGTEGAGYADVGLKAAIDRGIIPGPRLLVATRAVVASGSYGPSGFQSNFDVPQGAEEADGVDGVMQVVRDQIKHGADWIKIYADGGWGPNGENEPTFTPSELAAAVEAARSSG